MHRPTIGRTPHRPSTPIPSSATGSLPRIFTRFSYTKNACSVLDRAPSCTTIEVESRASGSDLSVRLPCREISETQGAAFGERYERAGTGSR